MQEGPFRTLPKPGATTSTSSTAGGTGADRTFGTLIGQSESLSSLSELAAPPRARSAASARRPSASAASPPRARAAPTLIGTAAAAPFFGRFGPGAADADGAAAAAAAALPFFLPLASAGELVCAAAGIFEVFAQPLLPAPVASPFLAFAELGLRTHRRAHAAGFSAAHSHRKLTHMHSYRNTHTHTHAHVHAHAHTHTRTHIRTHTHTRTRAQTHTHNTNPHTHTTRARAHAQTNTHTHVYLSSARATPC